MKTHPFDLPRYLALLPMFKGTPAARLERLAADCQLQRLARGDTAFRAGEPCQALHVTVTGQIKLFALSAGGQEKVIELAGPGMSLAEESVFSDTPYAVHAQALSDSVLLRIAKPALVAEVGGDGAMALRLLAGAGRRVQGLMQDIESQAMHSGARRVVDYLLRGFGTPSRAAATVALPVSKATIASRLSLTPEYFSRVLHALEQADLIEVDNRTIRIPDAQRLDRHLLAA